MTMMRVLCLTVIVVINCEKINSLALNQYEMVLGFNFRFWLLIQSESIKLHVSTVVYLV